MFIFSYHNIYLLLFLSVVSSLLNTITDVPHNTILRYVPALCKSGNILGHNVNILFWSISSSPLRYALSSQSWCVLVVSSSDLLSLHSCTTDLVWFLILISSNNGFTDAATKEKFGIHVIVVDVSSFELNIGSHLRFLVRKDQPWCVICWRLVSIEGLHNPTIKSPLLKHVYYLICQCHNNA